ncbi:hypothetical protein [Clostridium beijerinckii]|nr:hypothetical protein [Clostridium beijerinckii]
MNDIILTLFNVQYNKFMQNLPWYCKIGRCNGKVEGKNRVLRLKLKYF